MWTVIFCTVGYLIFLALALAFNYGAHRNDPPSID